MATKPDQDKIIPEHKVLHRLESQLPFWTFESGHVCRRYKTRNWKSSLMLVTTIGHLAELCWHHPDMEISYSTVTVKLMTHSAGGITDKDFELAEKIESVAQWDPLKDKGALGRTPDDPRYAYLSYD